MVKGKFGKSVECLLLAGIEKKDDANLYAALSYMVGPANAPPLWSGQWGALNKQGGKPITAQIFIKFRGKGLPWVRFRAWLRADAWVRVFMRVK